MKNERIGEKILHIEIGHVSYPEEEKAVDIRLDSKSVRLDVYVKDKKGIIFNIKMLF
ncbi:MAG: hypothetical protein PHQ44_00550 [Anaerovibrio sp.]|nr:hypothetical protein [Anaerovibrio sp.]